MSSPTKILKTVVFMGSARNIAAPWGGPSRLGTRVLAWVTQELRQRVRAHGSDVVGHEVTVLDPLELFGAGGALEESGGELRTPHFFFRKGGAPESMDLIAQKISSADCFVVVSAEYNHSIPPALSSLMSHFGSSNYAYKPCGIVTYSVGPYGGMRAAMALRPFLAEIGCLSVSKLVGLPSAHEIFSEDGVPVDPANRLLKVMPGMLDQLEFLALAVLKQREVEPGPP